MSRVESGDDLNSKSLNLHNDKYQLAFVNECKHSSTRELKDHVLRTKEYKIRSRDKNMIGATRGLNI